MSIESPAGAQLEEVAMSDRFPALPDGITGQELDRYARRQLRSLPDGLAEQVARHLVAAGHELDTDPEQAYLHALAARKLASRLAVVREACGEAAYAAGRYAEALAEFRAVVRMTAVADYLPVMADCERALGHPERALEMAQGQAAQQLDEEGQAELVLVTAGARLDLGQAEAAAALLAKAVSHDRVAAPIAARLRYGYAEALLACGKTDAALEWFARAATSDRDGRTDAAARAAALEGLHVVDVEGSGDDDK